jgi:hypothetical protein
VLGEIADGTSGRLDDETLLHDTVLEP